MYFQSQTLRRIYYKWVKNKPGGEFRLLPLFFLAGAGLEFCMIHWHVGEVNFYRTYKKREVERMVAERLREEETANSLDSKVE